MLKFKQKNLKKDLLGDKLKLKREAKGYSIKEASVKLKIPVEYLNAIENENWQLLPGEIYIKNFLKIYCEFLGVHFGLSFNYYKKHKELDLLKKTDIKQNKIKEYVNNVTPHTFRKIFFIVVLIFFLGYIYYETSNYLKPPKLEILSPNKDYITKDNLIIINGKTDEEALLYINGEGISLEKDGVFSIEVKLKYGLNNFEIISQRKHGRQHIENVVVFKEKN